MPSALAINGGILYRTTPFPSRAPFDDREVAFVTRAIRSQDLFGPGNKMVPEFERRFAALYGVRHAASRCSRSRTIPASTLLGVVLREFADRGVDVRGRCADRAAGRPGRPPELVACDLAPPEVDGFVLIRSEDLVQHIHSRRHWGCVVHPARQTRCVGRALLARVSPLGRGEVRSIIATTDVRALARYYAAGTVARFPILTLTGAPAEPAPTGGLAAERIDRAASVQFAKVAAIERAVLGYPRGEAELRWILERREGYLYRRGGAAVGFAFVGRDGAGSVAAPEPGDMPAVLAHVESRARALGTDSLSLQVPGLNAVAVRHRVARGFRIDPWVNRLMSNRPFGHFDRFIALQPGVPLSRTGR